MSTTTTSSTTTTTTTPIPPPSLDLIANAEVFRLGDLVQVDVCVDDHGELYDLYVGARLPNGVVITFADRNQCYPENVLGPFEEELFTGIFCINVIQANLVFAPLGGYSVCAWLVAPGSDPNNPANAVAIDCLSLLVLP